MKLIALAALLLLALPAAQASAEQDGYVYSPEGCDFRMTLPSEPQRTRRCHPYMRDNCALMDGFTKVYNMQSTINIYVTCEKTSRDTRRDYTQDVLQTLLLARPGIDDLETYQLTFEENERETVGALFGAGPSPTGYVAPMIYVAQFWVGEHSMMTIEAELIGENYDPADQAFAAILHSIHHVDFTPVPIETSAPDEADAE